jgi:hypothetical protein
LRILSLLERDFCAIQRRIQSEGKLRVKELRADAKVACGIRQ